jgi:hypothetical protein
MPENVTTLIAALVGALIGSVGAVVVENLYELRAEELRVRQNLTQRYLFQLQGIGFFQYDRIALAEAVMERSDQDFRASTYLEFRRRYQGHDSPERQWLAPAKEAIQQLTQDKMKDLLISLEEIAIRISEQTKITSSLTIRDNRSDIL